MRVFLTGATGFIGSRIVPKLLAAGHQVLGLTRSDSGRRSLEAAGAQAHFGHLEDLDSLRAGAQLADAVIHTAFDHDFSNFVANCEKDRTVIAAIGDTLKGSERPIIITSGTGMGDPGANGLAREDVFNSAHPNPRIASELAGNALLDAGVDVRVVRLPQVHDPVKQGLISPFVELSRQKGVVAYLGNGENRWPAAHVDDVATLFARVLDQGTVGERYHAVAEDGISMRLIAEAIGKGLSVPLVSLSADQAEAHFGWLASFVGLDMSASSVWTRERLGWHPTGPGLMADLHAMDYAVPTTPTV